MKYDVEICLTGNRAIERQDVDKVQLLNVGLGVLSVIKGGKNYCFSLDSILWYTITDKEDSECEK